ncbi:TPA: Eaa protein [Escherichia coli]|nr:Eaa protein [Escherichia coli]
MTTITDKKQYPGEQYLNELITNIEFAARAPVEVVRAMAAELQKRREADSAEPVSNHEELPLDYIQGQKDGLEWAAQLAEANHPQTGDWLYDDPVELAKAIRKGPDMPEAAGNSPVTPDGWVMVPKKLTAENGAKGVLSGEFSETTFISCPECFGDDDCDTCDGSGRIEIKVPVTWTTIKSIWDKGIAHFAAKPPQEVNRG